MNKKLVGIFLCMLLIGAGIVIVPKDLNVRADDEDPEYLGKVGLDYDFIYQKVKFLSEIATSDEAIDHGIYKGRAFATEGERYAADQIESWMNEITDNFNEPDIIRELIGDESGNWSYDSPPLELEVEKLYRKKINDKIEIIDYSLELKNGATTIEIPQKETFVYAQSMLLKNDERHYGPDGFLKLEMLNDDQSIMDWLHGETSFWSGLESDNIYVKNCSFILLGNQSYFISGNLVYIDDYSTASINETEGKIHLINVSDNEYNTTIEMLAEDYNASGFILMRDNVSNIQNWTVNISGVAISEENASMLCNLLQDDMIVVIPPNLIPEEDVETLAIFHINQGEKSIRKIGLYNITGQDDVNPDFYNLDSALYFLLNIGVLFCFEGFIIYNSSLPNTYVMNPSCAPNRDTYGDSWWRIKTGYFGSLWPQNWFWITGTIKIDDVFTPIDKWYYDSSNPKATWSVTQRYNTTPESYNIYYNVPGENSDKTFILSGGHYDGWWGQSTIDTATSVGIMLGILKYMNDSAITPKCNICFITFGGEEYKKRGSWSHVYNTSNEDLLEQTEFMLNMDVIAHNNPNSELDFTITDYLLKKVVWEIVNQTNYDEVFVSENYSIQTHKVEEPVYVTDAFPFYYRSNESLDDFIDIDFIGVGKENQTQYHQSGRDHTLGDTMDTLDRKDLSYTADIIWNITKYFAFDPDSWFSDVSYSAIDSPNDGDTLNDSIVVNFKLNSVVPHDKVTIEVYDLQLGSNYGPIDTVDYIIESGISEETYTYSIPDTVDQGDYELYLVLYNSTGRINKNIGENSEPDDSITLDKYHLYHPFGYPKEGELSQSVEDRISGSVFTLHEDCIVNNITAYIRTIRDEGYPAHYKCMVYRANDSQLIAITEEFTPDGNSIEDYSWVSFDFPDPPILNKTTEYVLVVWGDNDARIMYDDFSQAIGRYDYQTYGYLPPQANFTYESKIYSIYCSYIPLQNQTFYFDQYTIWDWDRYPNNMVDGNESTYASTPIDGDIQFCNRNTCLVADLAVITKVEIRVKGSYEPLENDADIILKPLLAGTTTLKEYTFDIPLPSALNQGIWSQWYNITDGFYPPVEWTWIDVINLDCEVKASGTSPFFVSCSKVEIRVTYYTTSFT